MTRSRSYMLFVYLLLAVAGSIFMFAPAESVVRATYIRGFTTVWGAFYLVGGVTAAIATTIRMRIINLVATWYFEMAGLTLLIAATALYFVAVSHRAQVENSLSLVGSSIIVLALASALSVRLGETMELVNIIRRYDRQLKQRRR